MKRRRTEIQLFGMSFLDVLACALGGTLLLLIVIMSSSRERVQFYETTLFGMRKEGAERLSRIDRLRGEIDRLQGDLEKDRQLFRDRQKQHRGEIAGLKKQLNGVMRELAREREAAGRDHAAGQRELAQARGQLADLENELAGAVGLGGQMKGVVFIFDTSESMATDRFKEYTGLLKSWVRHLRFERFNVIRFGSDVQAWSASGLQDSVGQKRDEALAFIDTFQPKGQTNTLAALRKALEDENVDTIILFSDGEPYRFQDGQPVLGRNGKPIRGREAIQEVHEYLREHGRGTVVNTVGMGNYLNQEYGKFLQDVARAHHGVFIGR